MRLEDFQHQLTSDSDQSPSTMCSQLSSTPKSVQRPVFGQQLGLSAQLVDGLLPPSSPSPPSSQELSSPDSLWEGFKPRPTSTQPLHGAEFLGDPEAILGDADRLSMFRSFLDAGLDYISSSDARADLNEPNEDFCFGLIESVFSIFIVACPCGQIFAREPTIFKRHYLLCPHQHASSDPTDVLTCPGESFVRLGLGEWADAEPAHPDVADAWRLSRQTVYTSCGLDWSVLAKTLSLCEGCGFVMGREHVISHRRICPSSYDSEAQS